MSAEELGHLDTWAGENIKILEQRMRNGRQLEIEGEKHFDISMFVLMGWVAVGHRETLGENPGPIYAGNVPHGACGVDEAVSKHLQVLRIRTVSEESKFDKTRNGINREGGLVDVSQQARGTECL